MALMSNDRIITLKVKDGMQAKTDQGVMDAHILTGENKLHAIHDPQTSFWSVHWDRGILSPALKQSWTSWQKMYDYLTMYFGKRNIELKEVIDINA